MVRFLTVMLVCIVLLNELNAQVTIDEISHQNRPHFQVKTANAIWLIDKYSGGVSGLIDNDGNDWIKWSSLNEEKYPESAAADYRGMPNLVFGGEDNGIGHPGFNKVMSFNENGNRIMVKSLNGKWEWQYIFHPKYVEMQILEISSERKFWFLYEGIPGGEFNPPEQYWGTNGGLHFSKPDYYNGEEIYGFWKWVFFGHEKVDRALYIVQQDEDSLKDTFGYLGNSEKGLAAPDGMVVFGFGRDKKATPLLDGKNTFFIGFYENSVNEDSFRMLEKYIQKTFY